MKIHLDIQTKYVEFSDEEVLNNILNEGAKKAKVVANQTLTRIKKVIAASAADTASSTSPTKSK